MNLYLVHPAHGLQPGQLPVPGGGDEHRGRVQVVVLQLGVVVEEGERATHLAQNNVLIYRVSHIIGSTLFLSFSRVLEHIRRNFS